MAFRFVVARVQSRFLLCLCPILLSGLQACIPTPSITHRVPVPDAAYGPVERPTGVEQMPIKVGTYFGSELAEYKYQEYTIGRNKIEIPVGAASQIHFGNVFAAMFTDTTKVQGRPPFETAGATSGMSAVVEVRIEDFRWTAEMLARPASATVTYRFVVYSPSGNTISSWTETGAGSGNSKFTEGPNTFVGRLIDDAMRVASGRFMDSFQRRPEMQRWLASVGDQKSASATSAAAAVPGGVSKKDAKRELEGVTIQATLYRQHGLDRFPYHPSGTGGQILAAQIDIRNDGPNTILVRPSDITLSPRESKTLFPASPSKVAQRIFQEPNKEGSDVAGGVNPILGLIVAAVEGSEKDSEVERITNHFRSNQLSDATIKPHESVSGYVYFEALGIDGKFQEAELRVRVGETSSTQNFDAKLKVGQGTAWASDLVAVSFDGATVASAKKRSSRQQPAATKNTTSLAPATVAGGRLTADEVKALIVGNTETGKYIDRGRTIAYSEYYREDGRIIGKDEIHGEYQGQYEIRADGCFYGDYPDDRYDGCFYFERIEGNRYRSTYPDGSSSIVTFLRSTQRESQPRNPGAAAAGAVSVGVTGAAGQTSVSSAPAATGPLLMTSAQGLLDLLSNTTASGTSESGTEFATYSRADGRMVARTAKGSVDEGVWEITPDGRYCRRWNNWRRGAWDCFHLYRLEDGRFRLKGINKPYESTVTLLPGDPRGLSRRMSTAEGTPLVVTAAVASGAAIETSRQASAQNPGPQQTSQQQDPTVAIAAAASAAAVRGPTSGRKIQSERLRVAILPVAKPRHLNWWDDDAFIQFGRELVSGRSNLHLSYSYGSRGPEKDLPIRPEAVWKGNTVRQVPDRPGVFALKDTFDVDIALGFYSAPKKAGADADSAATYRVEIYVFDLEFQRTYDGRGDERDYKNITENLFDDLMADREVSGKRIASSAEAIAADVAQRQQTTGFQVDARPHTVPISRKDSPIMREWSIGILPMKIFRSTSGSQSLEYAAGGELQTLLAKANDINIEYSVYSKFATASVDTATLWEGQVRHPTVREAQLRQLGTQLGVDYVMTAWLGIGPQSSSEDVIAWPLDIHVLRVRDGELKVFKTTNKSVAPAVEEIVTFIRQESSTSSAQPASVSAASITRPEPNEELRTVMGLEEGQLTEAEVRRYLTGNTLSGRTEKFVDFHIYYGRDGKMSGKAKATRYDAGRWQVLHNGWYCRQWDRWLNGTRECYKVFSAGGNRLHFRGVDSDQSATHTIRHGDPENLAGRI